MKPQNEEIRSIQMGHAPSKTYRMHIEQERTFGYTDELLAIEQAVYKALNTNRYEHVIYSEDYGIELQDLFGKPKYYVYPVLCMRIKECLLQDDRIEQVDSFFYDRENSKKDEVSIRFTVHSIFGEIEISEVFSFAL